MEPIITNNLERIAEICSKHHVSKLYVFGSATGRGIDGNPFGPDSDVDLLVEFTDIIYDFENFDYITNKYSLIDELEHLFARRVDLVTVSSLQNRRFIQYVEQQRELIYAA